MKVTVIGTGYLGAVHAACMAELGHDVLGIDHDAGKIDALASGSTPFFEPGLSEILARGLQSGRLRFSSSLQEAAEFGDVHFICVGTPQLPGAYGADLGYVDAALDGLAAHLRAPCLVAGKSTVPVGTANRLAARLARIAPCGAAAELAWNPEFLREGHAVQDTLGPDRLVVGVTSTSAEATMGQVYAPLLKDKRVPYIVTDLATAELVKVAANAFLATKISFINAMAEICEATGADVVTLADAIGADPRIGRRFLDAGLGFGGGCLPKDIRGFLARAEELGVGQALAFLRAVDEINIRRRHRTVKIALEMNHGTLVGRRMAVLGAAFKPNSDDIRDSPALHVASALRSHGAQVRVHDPEAIENARVHFPSLDYTSDVMKAVEGADLVLHLTEWEQYRGVDPEAVIGMVRTPQVLDARNALDRNRWQRAGWIVRVLGRADISTARRVPACPSARDTASDLV